MATLTPERISELEETARLLRVDSLRLIHHRGAGHPGGALSAAEIMAVLYFHVLRIDPSRPDWEERDRFILSKGHASALLYAALTRRGFFPRAAYFFLLPGCSLFFPFIWPLVTLRRTSRTSFMPSILERMRAT